jgi:hypothetical protein
MKKVAIILLLVLIVKNSFAQQNKIKFGFIGFPSQSGFGIGNLGYERMNKALNNSWQFHINGSGGAIATDVGTETRKWVTIERTFYKKSISKAITWSYSFFTETGNRVKENGDRVDDLSKIFDKRKLFEINPGASLGIQIHIGKKWGIETQAGPKLIFANGKEYYINGLISSSNNTFTENVSYTKAGYRFMGAVYFQF